MLQILTRDHWNTLVVRPLVRTSPFFGGVFFFYFFIGKWGLLNTIIGVLAELVHTLEKVNTKRHEKTRLEREAKILDHVRQVFLSADVDGSGDVDFEEFRVVMQKRHVQEKMNSIEIPLDDVRELFKLLDRDGRGAITIEDFIMGCKRINGVARSRDMFRVSA